MVVMTGDESAAPLVLYSETEGLDYARLFAAWRDELQDDELARLEVLRFERDRRDYLAAHVLQRLGARRADAAGRQSNLSHTDGLAACAFASSESHGVGIDAEPLSSGARLDSIVDDFVAPDEMNQLKGGADARQLALLHLWTVKEAWLKSRGEGIAEAGGFDVFRMIECSPMARVDVWSTIAVRDVRTDARGHGWVCLLGGHVLGLVDQGVSGALPRLERVTIA
jgi:hypothetical protein